MNNVDTMALSDKARDEYRSQTYNLMMSLMAGFNDGVNAVMSQEIEMEDFAPDDIFDSKFKEG